MFNLTNDGDPNWQTYFSDGWLSHQARFCQSMSLSENMVIQISLFIINLPFIIHNCYFGAFPIFRHTQISNWKKKLTYIMYIQIYIYIPSVLRLYPEYGRYIIHFHLHPNIISSCFCKVIWKCKIFHDYPYWSHLDLECTYIYIYNIHMCVNTYVYVFTYIFLYVYIYI